MYVLHFFQVLTMWVVISPYEIFDHINIELYFNILYFCRLMFYINSAINPILYNTMSSRQAGPSVDNIPGTDLIMTTVFRFRDRFRRVFGCGKSLIFKKRSATQSHTSSTRWKYTHSISIVRLYSNSNLIFCRFSNSLSHKVENQNQGWSEKLQGK